MIGLGSKRMSSGDNSGRDKAKSGKDAKVSMYSSVPIEEIDLESFETFSLDRLQVLHGMDTNKARGLKGEEYKIAMSKLLDTYLPLKTPEDVRKDNISHYILRIAYCNTEENRRWFLSHECSLFQMRIEGETPQAVTQFLRDNNMEYQEVTIGSEEHSSVRYQLDMTFKSCNLSSKTSDVTSYYKVPFEEALDLIGRRQVYVKQGWAYVPRQSMVSIIVSRFRMQMSKSLAVISKSLGNIMRDERLAPLLSNMHKQYVGKDYSNSTVTDAVTPEQLDSLAKTSMPLCMSHLHNALKTDSHLKHSGRMQYGLFLKGIGLKLEDALMFWKFHFSKKHGADGFDKKYAYNIRHNYGKEGKRVDYTPYSCMKIIQGPAPSASEAHGCPFKHWDESHLSAKLSKMGISTSDVTGIVESAKSHNYQVACRRYWEATHKGGNSDSVGNHPNAYFEASMEYYRGKQGGDNKAVSTADASIPPVINESQNDMNE